MVRQWVPRRVTALKCCGDPTRAPCHGPRAVPVPPPPSHSMLLQISKSVGGGVDADLNKDSGGRPVFLCIARKPAAAPVTAVAVVFGIAGEFFPPGDAACGRTWGCTGVL